MKIRDVVVEVGPVAYEKGKSKMDKALSPSKWLDGTNTKLQYDTGKDKMDKLLTPSRWFEPSNSDTKSKDTKSNSLTDTNELKVIVDQAMANKPLDIKSLQKLRTYKANISDPEVQDTIEKILNGRRLDSQDIFTLKSFRNTL